MPDMLFRGLLDLFGLSVVVIFNLKPSLFVPIVKTGTHLRRLPSSRYDGGGR